MLEVDFLPAWYVGVRRQRALLTAQTYATAGLVIAGVVAIAAVHGRAREASAAFVAAEGRAAQATQTVRQLDETLALQQQLVDKQRVLSDVGLGVEASRVVAEVVACAPRELCFDGIDVRTDEQTRTATIADRARGAAGPTVTRRLQLRVTGVAPTEDAVTEFWTQLMRRPYVEEPRIMFTSELIALEHTMRTFEVTLAIPLDVPTTKAGN